MCQEIWQMKCQITFIEMTNVMSNGMPDGMSNGLKDGLLAMSN